MVLDWKREYEWWEQHSWDGEKGLRNALKHAKQAGLALKSLIESRLKDWFSGERIRFSSAPEVLIEAALITMSPSQKRTKIEYPRGYWFVICQHDVHILCHYQVSNNNRKRFVTRDTSGFWFFTPSYKSWQNIRPWLALRYTLEVS